MIEHRWVMISGVGPGAGKSTLGARLARELRKGGTPVDLIPEEDLFVRPEFAEAGAGFREERFELMSDHLLAAYGRVAEKADREGNVVIFDWEAAGMVEDLPFAAEQEALNAHMKSVMEIVAAFNPILLYLDAPLYAAFARAVAERGDPWVQRYARLGSEKGISRSGTLEQQAFEYLDSDSSWRARERAAYESCQWPQIEIDANRPAEAVLVDALGICLGGK